MPQSKNSWATLQRQFKRLKRLTNTSNIDDRTEDTNTLFVNSNKLTNSMEQTSSNVWTNSIKRIKKRLGHSEKRNDYSDANVIREEILPRVIKTNNLEQSITRDESLLLQPKALTADENKIFLSVFKKYKVNHHYRSFFNSNRNQIEKVLRTCLNDNNLVSSFEKLIKILIYKEISNDYFGLHSLIEKKIEERMNDFNIFIVEETHLKNLLFLMLKDFHDDWYIHQMHFMPKDLQETYNTKKESALQEEESCYLPMKGFLANFDEQPVYMNVNPSTIEKRHLGNLVEDVVKGESNKPSGNPRGVKYFNTEQIKKSKNELNNKVTNRNIADSNQGPIVPPRGVLKPR